MCSDLLMVVDGWNQNCGGFAVDVDISSVEAHIGVMFYCQPFFSTQLGDTIQDSTQTYSNQITSLMILNKFRRSNIDREYTLEDVVRVGNL